MDFAPVKELPGRVRVKLRGPVPEGDVSALEQVVRACPDVTKATVYPRNGEIAISYAAGEGAKERVFCHLVGIKAADIEAARELAAYDPSAQTRALVQDILWLVGSHYARRWFLPAPLRTAWTVWSYRHFLAAALDSLAHGRLDVPVLDAAAARNLQHRERHAEVEYIVAHGIASSLDGKRCVIGSEHFVVEDEGSSSMRRPMPASSRRSAQYPRFTWRWTASLWVSSAFMTPSSRAFPRLWRSCAVWASGTSSCSPATTSAQLRLWPLRRASPSSAQTCFPNRSTHTYRLDAAEVVEAQDVEVVEG